MESYARPELSIRKMNVQKPIKSNTVAKISLTISDAVQINQLNVKNTI
jgi:flavoprotein